ncbi:MAG: sigma-54-dependent Fis family transcriptional regulator [Acidobacteria bacterium]|nr:sigma-54-dependent Fis family transcriptional regulator [Acidobacteriota bacterium]
MTQVAVGTTEPFPELIGLSRQMAEVRQLMLGACHSDANVLLIGETGSGKDHVASIVHRHSPCQRGEFVKVNCATLGPELAESALFGHCRGAFTGAIRDKIGYFKEADGGTLFLNDIQTLSLDVQAKLLTAIEDKQVIPVGNTTVRSMDVRIIAASNENLQELMARGQLRKDLYFRLAEIRIELPSLRERTEDIPLFIAHFLQEFTPAGNRHITLDRETQAALLAYHWPGNVRELRNVLRRIATYCAQQNMLVVRFACARRYMDWLNGQTETALTELSMSYKDQERAAKQQIISRTLRTCQWDLVLAAKVLQISLPELRRKIRVFRLRQAS